MVVEFLGKLVEAGLFVTGSIGESGPGGRADLRIPIHGPLGAGTFYPCRNSWRAALSGA